MPEGAVEQGGQVLVPLKALQEERQAAKALKAKADQYDQVGQWYQQSKPYIDFLQAHPELLTRATPAPTQAEPQTDAKFMQLAQTLDLYTPEGKPDAARAKSLADFMRGEAREEAQTLVRPVQAQTLQQQAVSNYHQAVNTPLPNGSKVDPNMLWQIWSQGDPAVLASPQGAAAAVALALGMQSMQQATPVPAPSGPPVVTEQVGGRFGVPAPLSALDQRVMQVRGIDSKKYAEYAKQFRPGESNTLEE